MQVNDLIINKKYELIDQIGEGSFGIVYKAKLLSTGKTVALKTLKSFANQHKQFSNQLLQQFEIEAQLCAQINHPYIIKFLDKGITNNKTPFVVFEFVEGDTLRSHIIKEFRFYPKIVGTIIKQILEALAYIHSKGIIHRDLTPNNIIITNNSSETYAKILDFGIGAFHKEFHPHTNSQSKITKHFLGTPSYCAPEQLKGEPPTIKSDLYAWGLIAIECISGKAAMDEKTIEDILQQQLSTEPVILPQVLINHPLGHLLKKVLEKNPSDRLGDANEILNEMENIDLNSLNEFIKNISNNEFNKYAYINTSTKILTIPTKG